MNKKLLALSIGCLVLASCGTYNSDVPATPKAVSLKLDQVPSGTSMDVIAIIPMDVPHQGNNQVRNSTVFRVAHDVLAPTSSTVLIPQNAMLKGVYQNNGQSCQISWQVLYQNYRAMELDIGNLTIASRLDNTNCDPKLGIQPGQITQVNFK